MNGSCGLSGDLIMNKNIHVKSEEGEKDEELKKICDMSNRDFESIGRKTFADAKIVKFC